jgi:hypothetical protein
MKVGAKVDPLLNPALLGKGVIFPIGSVFHSHQGRIRNHECLGELVVQPPTKLKLGDVNQWPFGVRLDGQRGERGSNAFSRRVDILCFLLKEFRDFERMILELKIAQRHKKE